MKKTCIALFFSLRYVALSYWKQKVFHIYMWITLWKTPQTSYKYIGLSVIHTDVDNFAENILRKLAGNHAE